MQLVRSEVEGRVARVTLGSPHNRNALSSALLRQLLDGLRTAADDRRVRVIVLTGDGPAFCSGADLSEQRGDAVAQDSTLLPDVLLQIWESSTPVVARVNGAARGGGVGLVAACDIAVAPRSATFAFSEVHVGVVPAIIAPFVLARVQPRAAAELFLTGARVTAGRAAAVGLLSAAVDDADLDGAVDDLVGQLLLGAPEALGIAKDLPRRIAGDQPRRALAGLTELSLERFRSAEAREGMAAFLERRPPSWAPPS